MQWDVVEIEPAGNRTLKVRFADGLTGTIHLATSYCTGVFGPLLDDKVLEQAGVQHGAVTWPNGLDLAPDTMYREIQSSPARHYEVGQRQATQEQIAS
jgi:hypothetical protein